MSRRRQPALVSDAAHRLLRTASSIGEIEVQEYGYGLGPPTGILVLRYPPGSGVPDFPEDRDDFLHQVFWSPDGVLALRRGTASRFVTADEMLWVRRGVVAEVHGLGVQTVLRACLRQAPQTLVDRAAAVLAPGQQVGARLQAIARPGVTEAEGLQARADVLAALARCPVEEVDHGSTGPVAGPAQMVARALLADPSDPTSLGEWASRLHVSPKTLQRDIERQYAVAFTTLRTRIRLRAAAALLRSRSVTETAHLVGYGSASAFVAAFTREFGETPGRYTGERAAS
ncbi:helix-turn-helix domain-containing protein [Nocardioides sp. BGMRC 2183]|nr:helix-turn-helix domain-containing protein [Nocardioides sp. BGMRC 2183]